MQPHDVESLITILSGVVIVGVAFALFFVKNSQKKRRAEALSDFALRSGFLVDAPTDGGSTPSPGAPGYPTGPGETTGSPIADFLVGILKQVMGQPQTPKRAALSTEVSGILFFKKHSWRKMENLLYQEYQDGTIYLFDGAWAKGNNNYYYRTVAVASDRRVDVPHLSVTRKSLLNSGNKKIGPVVDIGFDPDFSELFVLRGANDYETMSVFNDTLCRWMVEKKELIHDLEAFGMIVVLSGPRKRLTTEQTGELALAARELANMWAGTAR
ncbi:MAG: hypothetical protein JW885_11965 [Deltaproteobacteria bacterium]|nr:hypothetical protein [Candidatus Zymogenaceae bacterium]